jgi:Carboxypeptidase regulatory-like domain/TonB dependent receptor
MASKLVRSLLVLSLAGLSIPSSMAQLYSGSISGGISDPTGAVVPGVRVIVTDMGKQTSISTTADSEGRYVVSSLPPATYTVTVEQTGFKTWTAENIVLAVNANVAVNVTLELGSETQHIEVRGAGAAVLQTQDAEVGQELNRTMINELPLLGRGVYDLATLAPGVHGREGSAANGGNNFISNGSRNSTSDILMDGVSATSFEQNSGILTPLYTPSVDAVQEFKIDQSNFSAEIGFSGSTVINMVTRSGTNEFHGSGWEFLRNNVLTANNFFSNANGQPLAARRFNQFGGTVGGPIVRNKTFFFFDYEGTRDTAAQTYQFGVPSAAERTGNFGELCGAGFDSAGRCTDPAGQIWDPYTGVYDENAGGAVRSAYIPFNDLSKYESPGNPKLNGTPYQLPARVGNLIDPVAQKIMSYIPLPNVARTTPGYSPYNNWFGTGSNRNQNDQFDIKIDHNFNDTNRLSAKYAQALNNSQTGNAFSNPAFFPIYDPGVTHSHLFALNFTRTISPTTLLNVAYGFTRRYDNTTNAPFDPTTLGLPSYMSMSGFPGAPSITLDQYYTPHFETTYGAGTWNNFRDSPETHQLSGGISHVQGGHDMRIGGEARLHRMNEDQPGYPNGAFHYDRNGTSQMPNVGGDSMASFMVGQTGSGGGLYEIPVFVSTQSWQFAGYFQDNWKVTPKLTLNLGIRYDLETPRTERYNRMSYVDPTAPSPLKIPGMPDLRGVLAFVNKENRQNYDWDPNNFGPRFGFAYSLTPKTVMRGGYGIFYTATTRGAAGNAAYGVQGFDRITTQMSTYQFDNATPGARLSNPYPGGPLLPPGSSLGGFSYVGESIRGPIKSQNATPYEQSWSFGFQRQLPADMLVEADYLGKKGTKLLFGGAQELNYLGPQIESYNSSQIADLFTQVPNPFYGYIPADTTLGGPLIQKYRLQVPFPQFASVQGVAPPVANSIYHALQLRTEKRFSHGVQLLVNYTWSKSIDDASITHDGLTWLGGAPSLQDPNNYRLERSVSQFDLTHVLNVAYVLDLPFGRGRKFGSNWNPVIEAILGGWKTNGIWTFESGFPLALTLADPLSLPTYGAQRPNLIGPLKRNTGSDWLHQYFANPEVVVKPPDYALGTAPRTLSSVRAPGVENFNMSLLKEFPLPFREGMRLEFRAEAFNTFNHPQFAAPNTSLDSGSFGIVSSQQNSPRELQLGMKFYW